MYFLITIHRSPFIEHSIPFFTRYCFSERFNTDPVTRPNVQIFSTVCGPVHHHWTCKIGANERIIIKKGTKTRVKKKGRPHFSNLRKVAVEATGGERGRWETENWVRTVRAKKLECIKKSRLEEKYSGWNRKKGITCRTWCGFSALFSFPGDTGTRNSRTHSQCSASFSPPNSYSRNWN